MRISDWSSDVCSSDLELIGAAHHRQQHRIHLQRMHVRGAKTIASVPTALALANTPEAAVPCRHPVDVSADGVHEHRSAERREGKSVSLRVDLGGRRILKKKKLTHSIRKK